MSVLIIDNYDSFTHNLYQLLGGLGVGVEVRRNDEIDLASILEMAPSHIVLSPGPGHPKNERDFGICGRVVRFLSDQFPVLGVCLGHQGIVHHLGGRVVRAPTIVHGKSCRISHDGQGLFRGLNPDLEVMRYHSLVAESEFLPEDLEVSAETADGLIMAVAHRHRPLVGVQFHPESIGTPQGVHLMRNFLEMG